MLNFNLEDLEDKERIVDPRFLLLISQPKVGKTSALMQLPNSLIIDLEDSTGFFEKPSCKPLNLKQYAIKNNCSLLDIYLALIPKLEKNKYDFVILDTVSALETLAIEYATKKYKSSILGKNFKGTNIISELSNGAGYSWYNTAFEELIEPLRYIPNKCFIVSAHIKFISIAKNKDGTVKDNTDERSAPETVNVIDLDLMGTKPKKLLASQVDGTGILFRSKLKHNTVGISFKPLQGSHLNESRSQHLRGKRFILSEYDDETATLKTYWNNIFTSLNAKGVTPQNMEINEDIFIPLSED